MRKYAFNDTTHEMLSLFAAQPSGSLLLTGVEGSGITTAITYVLNSIYGNALHAGEVIYLEKPYTIAGVRALILNISRTRSNSQKPRIIVIDNADELKVDSQNTLLKSIEEPPKNTHFILGSSHLENLLPTIVSRCQRIDIKRPNKEDLQKLFSSLDDTEFDKLYAMSDGWPGVLRELSEDKDSKFYQQVTKSKEFLSVSRTAKLGIVIAFKTNEDLTEILDGLTRIARAALRSSEPNSQQEKNWLRIYKICQTSYKQLFSGVSFKLISLNLASKI